MKGLCQKFDGDVLLTSRDVERGTNAVKSLNEVNFFNFYNEYNILFSNELFMMHYYV